MKKELGSDPNDYKFQYLLYKSTFHPSFKNLAMIYQNEGVFLIAAELQARWASLVFSGKLNPPENELMRREISKLAEKRDLNLRQQYPYGSQVDVIDSLAKEVGLAHDFEKIEREDPRLFRQLWNNATLACQFRLEEAESVEVLNEIDRLAAEEYTFEDDDSGKREVSISEIARKFKEKQFMYNVPMHLFRT